MINTVSSLLYQPSHDQIYTLPMTGAEIFPKLEALLYELYKIAKIFIRGLKEQYRYD